MEKKLNLEVLLQLLSLILDYDGEMAYLQEYYGTINDACEDEIARADEWLGMELDEISEGTQIDNTLIKETFMEMYQAIH